MASSTSTPTSTSAASPYNYDVFINHRGPDVKKTFASYLYRRLLIHGLRVFLDQPELQGGDDLTPQIHGAIDTASVQVAIFSPTYAQSTWCLNELIRMLGTLEKGATILPVFYNVKPSDLRWNRGEKGPYAEALHNLENKKTDEGKSRHDPVIIENWRNALSRLSHKSGFELAKYNGDEGELLEEVVQRVLKKVKKPGLEVAKYPTGLDDKMEDFETTVLMPQRQSGKPQILGIVGLGGVGKTTLAKEFFNRKNSDYGQSSCFLSDVREKAAKGSLHLLQRELMNSLTGWGTEINSVDEGTGMLRNLLSFSKALVVLDDVDEVKQVDALFPVRTVPHPDSLFLITSRSIDVLRRSRVEESSIYNLSGLNAEHSRELFCFHSFSQAHPLPGFEDLVSKFVKACDGLPLSLIVFGALVYGNNEPSYWEEQLHKLQRILPAEIKQRLKISYDALDVEEQHIFLDIACFFIGQDRDTAIRIWDGSGWDGRLGFRNIMNRCLVRVDYQNYIHMHDHLRDLGREIAVQTPGLPLRLWQGIGIGSILQQSCVRRDVRGIRMIAENNDNDGIRMSKLQLLDVEDGLLESLFQRVKFPNLLWLRWKACPYSSPPSWIPMKDLRVLQVQSGQLETLWQEESQVPLQLRELEISSPLLNIPKSIGQLKHLERIVVSGGRQVTLPREFCHLQSLKLLKFEDCSEMKTLPDCFGNLTSLQRLELFGCKKLERLPNSFGNLTNFKYLSLVRCSNVTMSSDTFGNISTLEDIRIEHCEKIEVLAQQVAHQKSLEELHLSHTGFKELPNEIGDLSELKYLNLESCSLDKVPASLGALRSLTLLALVYCHNLKCLPPSIRMLTHLKYLRLSHTPITELPFSKALEGERETSPSLSNMDSPIEQCMPRLEYMSLIGTKISELSFSTGVCPNLDELDLSDCEDLVEIGTLPNTLMYLDARGCGKLKTIRGVGWLTKLKQLNVSYCSALEDLPSVEHLRSLVNINLRNCHKLKTIRGLGWLTKLEQLDVSGCSALEDLPGVEHLRSLVKLDLTHCHKLRFASVSVIYQLARSVRKFDYIY